MMLLMNMMSLMFLISNIMMIMSFTLSKKSNSDQEKLSPFECGFEPTSSARIPFSLMFFLITVIFLIFDIEIALLLPPIMLYKISNFYYWLASIMFFIIILILGIYHEWNQNMLNWKF